MDELTIPEYEILMEAHELKKVDEEYRVARQAFENQRVQATKGSKHPSAVFKTLESFYNFKQREKEVKQAFSDNTETNRNKLNFNELIKHRKEVEENG